MTDREYEALVQQLIDELRRSVTPLSAAEVRGGSKNRISGASGFSHQIDVSLHAQNTLVLVECKQWLEPVGAEAVLTLASRLADIRASNSSSNVHASLVSTKPSTRGAELLASYFGVNLDTVASAREYGLRLSNHVFVTAHDTISFTDRADAEVIRGQEG